MLDWTAMTEAIAPELLLVAMGLVGVVIGAVVGDRFNRISFKLGALTLFAAAALSILYRDGDIAMGGLVETNAFINYAKALSYVLAGIALWISQGFLSRDGTIRYEYPLLMLFAAFGLGITLSAADLMTLYMGVETLSLASYVLAAFHRDSPRSAEAGLKYFVLGALASGLLLYGASLVYGFTGETAYAGIARSELGLGGLFGMILMITGLAFKVSAAPMHVWTPDVYEGAPSPVVAFFASAPKLAMMVVFANVMFTAFAGAIADWQAVIGIIAGASMVVGALGALVQRNIKRLLGYSSIANMGYALVPVAAGAQLGAPALLVFMTLYVIAALGMFAGVLAMRRKGGMVEDIHELSGLIQTRPGLALGLTAIIFSIAGIPPLAGFFGKLEVILAGLDAGLLPLVILLILSSVVSLGYYLRLVIIMWVNEPSERFQTVEPSVTVTVAVTGLLMLPVLPLLMGTLTGLAETAAAGLVS